jgi:hypothetical protein
MFSDCIALLLLSFKLCALTAASRPGGGTPAAASRRVDERTARHLSSERDEAPDGQNESDIDLGPFLRGQVDGDERTEASLDVGDGEDKPVQSSSAAPRWT